MISDKLFIFYGGGNRGSEIKLNHTLNQIYNEPDPGNCGANRREHKEAT